MSFDRQGQTMAENTGHRIDPLLYLRTVSAGDTHALIRRRRSSREC